MLNASPLPSSAPEEAGETKFDPPLWMQRRQLARDTLAKHGSRKVIDFGCGEGALLTLLIGECDDDPITHLAGLDISKESLEMAKEDSLPRECDLGVWRRVHELEIQLYQGSVAESDPRLKGYDALVSLEVVEHLDPHVLNEFWNVVLGTYKPKLAIVSTPNAEFNIYFPQLKYGTPEASFRHWDHRFEWTRAQWETWCRAAARDFGYSVSFTGVGTLHHQDHAVGYCTQFAILIDLDPSSASRFPFTGERYSLQETIKYPFYEILHSDQEISDLLHLEISLIHTRQMQSSPDCINTVGKGKFADVSLESLWSGFRVRQHCKVKETMYRVLKASPYLTLDLVKQQVTFQESDPFWVEQQESGLYDVGQERSGDESDQFSLESSGESDASEYKLSSDQRLLVQQEYAESSWGTWGNPGLTIENTVDENTAVWESEPEVQSLDGWGTWEAGTRPSTRRPRTLNASQ